MALGKRWTRDDLLIALNLYRKLFFSQFDAREPVIRDVSERMGRSPGSLAMKLCNLASLDPVHQLRGVGGLPNVSALDRELWDEYQADPNIIVPAGEQAFRRYLV